MLYKNRDALIEAATIFSSKEVADTVMRASKLEDVVAPWKSYATDIIERMTEEVNAEGLRNGRAIFLMALSCMVFYLGKLIWNLASAKGFMDFLVIFWDNTALTFPFLFVFWFIFAVVRTRSMTVRSGQLSREAALAISMCYDALFCQVTVRDHLTKYSKEKFASSEILDKPYLHSAMIDLKLCIIHSRYMPRKIREIITEKLDWFVLHILTQHNTNQHFDGNYKMVVDEKQLRSM